MLIVQLTRSGSWNRAVTGNLPYRQEQGENGWPRAGGVAAAPPTHPAAEEAALQRRSGGDDAAFLRRSHPATVLLATRFLEMTVHMLKRSFNSSNCS